MELCKSQSCWVCFLEEQAVKTAKMMVDLCIFDQVTQWDVRMRVLSFFVVFAITESKRRLDSSTGFNVVYLTHLTCRVS